MDSVLVDKKEEIGQLMANTIANAYADGKIDYMTMKQISGFILNQIDLLETEGEMKALLKTLSEQWPIFSDLQKTQTGVETSAKEQEVITKLSQYIRGL